MLPFRAVPGWTYRLLPTLVLLAAPVRPETSGPRYTASLGSVTLGQEQLYRMCLRPDIALGRWGVAMDLEVFIDGRGRLSSRGWNLGSTTQALDSFLRKIYYVRYGRPGDAVHVVVGALDHVTLGYGLIMSGYRNTLQYPGVKRAGAQLQCHGVGAPGLGIEAVVGDLQDLETGGPLVGLRVSHRPAGGFEVGATWVVDLDQYGGLRDADGDGYPDAVDAFPRDASRALDNDGDGVADEVDGDDDNDGRFDVDPGSGLPADLRAALDSLSVRYGEAALPLQHQLPRRRPFNRHRVGRDGFGAFGVDAAYPLVRRPDRELAVYAQMAVYLDDRDDLDPAAADAQGVTPGNRRASGFGLAAPGIRARAGPIAGQLELRYCARDFVAGYFGELYDLDRVRLDLASGRATPKDAGLQRRGGRAGAFGSATANLRDLLEATGEYEFLAGSPSAQRLQAGAALSPRLVRLVPRLEEARAYYRKDDIGRRGEGFLEPSEDTFYGYAFGVQVAAGVSVRWDTRYVYVRRADARLQRQKTMTVETVFTL